LNCRCSDCNSDDVPNLEVEIRKIWQGKLIFSSESAQFTRSFFFFNKAVKQSHHDILFICDADFSMPTDLVLSCNKYTLGNIGMVSHSVYLYKNKPNVYGKANGEWMQWGRKGIFACKRKYFDK
jgi:hypothetical protein